MTPESLVTSLATSRRLKEAGFGQDTYFSWGNKYDEPRIYRTDGCCGDWISPDDIVAAAPTAGELLEALAADGYSASVGAMGTTGYVASCVASKAGTVPTFVNTPERVPASSAPEALALLWMKVKA